MRVSSYAVARPAYYDRNAASSILGYSADVAPHTVTTRATYTGAAGKKTYVEYALASCRVSTVGTVSGRRFGIVRITDATTATCDIARIDGASSLVANTVVSDKCQGMPTIYAGETVTFLTADGTTGGTIDWVLNAKFTTFDA